MCVENMLVPWIQRNIQVVAQLPRIDVWKQQNYKKYHMYIAREDARNILSYVGFQYFVMSYSAILN